MLSLGFGASVMGALAVPVLNFLVIPCAVAGATAMWVEELSKAAEASADGEETK
jgi:CysZ protein